MPYFGEKEVEMYQGAVSWGFFYVSVERMVENHSRFKMASMKDKGFEMKRAS